MESWKVVWRNGLAPLLSDKHLKALEEGLREDDPNLVQGCTTTPPPLQCVAEWPVEAACALGYCGWKGDELITVSEVEEFFARMCFAIDQKIGEPAGCRWFLNFWDDTPRQEVLRLMLSEVRIELDNRLKLKKAEYEKNHPNARTFHTG